MTADRRLWYLSKAVIREGGQMGAWGGIIMSFFGAVFAAMTLALQFGWRGTSLSLPFIAFAAISTVAVVISRRPGPGITRSEHAKRVIMWSTIGEGVGLFVAGNVVMNLGRPELLLPATALVVGLHFLPMAWSIPFRPFYTLGLLLVVAATLGFALDQAEGITIAGFTSTAALWTAAMFAVCREMKAKASEVNSGASRSPV